jgi:hypothetical protein
MITSKIFILIRKKEGMGMGDSKNDLYDWLLDGS